jgi:hypothetical protein
MLGIPHCLDSQLTDGGKVVSITHRPLLYSPETLFLCFWYSFLLEGIEAIPYLYVQSYPSLCVCQNDDLKQSSFQSVPEEEEVDRTIWGELESESEEESEEEEEEDEEGEKEDETGLVTPAEGLITPSGITSIPAGMETPEIIELRKRKIESEMEGYDH